MYWNEDNFQEWVKHINSIVGEDSAEGGFLVAEKTDGVEVTMAGDPQELLQLLAASVYDYSKMNEMAFEDVMSAITDKWAEMRKSKGYMQCGNELVDLETGIGYNSETEMISLPIPPQEVQEQLLSWIEKTNSKTEKVKEHLHSVEDIMDFFNECSTVAGFTADEETGEQGITFVYHDDRFIYYPNNPGTLGYQSDEGISIDIFEEDDLFRKVVMRLLEQ